MSDVKISEDVLNVLVDAADKFIEMQRLQLENIREEEDVNDIRIFEDGISRCERALMVVEDAIYKSSF